MCVGGLCLQEAHIYTDVSLLDGSLPNAVSHAHIVTVLLFVWRKKYFLQKVFKTVCKKTCFS